MRTLFLLGSERSGSTWLANLIDAHPQVELFMEPLADYAGLLPGLPEREVALPDPSREQAAILRAGLDALPAHKHALLFSPGRPRLLRAVDRGLARLARAAAARLGFGPGPLVLRHELLSLHNAALPAALLGPKHRTPALRVVKELRLNLQVPLLAHAFPQARVAVILRDPVTQIASILRRFATGGLGELARSLDRTFPGGTGQRRLAPFRERIAATNPRANPVETLALWWVMSHAVLFEDLAACGLPCHVLSHESLCTAAERETAELLRFAGLPPSPEVDALLHWSTTGDGDHEDPVDTRRVSARVPEAARAALASDLGRAIEEALLAAAEGVDLAPPLAALLEPLGLARCGEPDRRTGASGAY